MGSWYRSLHAPATHALRQRFGPGSAQESTQILDKKRLSALAGQQQEGQQSDVETALIHNIHHKSFHPIIHERKLGVKPGKQIPQKSKGANRIHGSPPNLPH